MHLQKTGLIRIPGSFGKMFSSADPKVHITPQEVNGVRGEKNISDMWKEHYAELFNSVHNTQHKTFVFHKCFMLCVTTIL